MKCSRKIFNSAGFLLIAVWSLITMLQRQKRNVTDQGLDMDAGNWMTTKRFVDPVLLLFGLRLRPPPPPPESIKVV